MSEDTPLVGVVVRHAEPKLLVSMEADDSHGWMQIGWIAQDD